MTNYQDVRLFDFLTQGLNEFPKEDMLCGKEGESWKPLSTIKVAELVNKLSAGLLRLGLGKGDRTLEEQLKVSVISRNRPEWLILDLACFALSILQLMKRKFNSFLMMHRCNTFLFPEKIFCIK